MILVTGGNGFLGKHVKEELSKHDIKALYPTSKELDLTSHNSTIDYFERHRPDTVLHLAAFCSLDIKNKPAETLLDNAKMANNIFSAVLKYNIQYVYSTGSICMYGGDAPFIERNIFDNEPNSHVPYSYAKRLLLSLHQTFHYQYKTKGLQFILANQYGPLDHFDINNSRVIPSLIRKFSEAVEQGKSEVICTGASSPEVEFCYVENTAQAIVGAITNKVHSLIPVNIGTGSTISIKNLASLIGQLTGFKGDIVFTGEVYDQPKRQLDVSRAKELLGFEAKTNLLTGLTKTISWYDENKGNL